MKVSIVSGHINAAKIALQVAALRAGHLVAAIAFDEWLFTFVAIADEGLAPGFLDSVTMAESRLLVSLTLIFLAGIGNMRLLLTFATAGDVAGRRLTMKLEINVYGETDCLEVATGAAFNIIDAGSTKVVLLTQAHEFVDQCVDIWNQTKLRFANCVTATTRTSKLGAALSNF